MVLKNGESLVDFMIYDAEKRRKLVVFLSVASGFVSQMLLILGSLKERGTVQILFVSLFGQ